MENNALVYSTLTLPGDKQMVLDLQLLDQTISKPEIIFTLRFYHWQGDWLSIGYHQKDIPSRWEKLLDDGVIKIVRRPSGGGAVLHSKGITYALTFKKTSYKSFRYELVNNWLIKSFKEFGLILKTGHLKKSTIKENCFGTSYISDLVDQEGYKRIGSAQYRKKSGFLQHGEILLNPPSELWLKIFGEECPPKVKFTLDKEEIINELKHSFLENYSDPSVENVFISLEDIKQLNLRNYI